MRVKIKLDQAIPVWSQAVKSGLRGGSSTAALRTAATRSAGVTRHEIRKQIDKWAREQSGALKKSFKISVNLSPVGWVGSVSTDSPYAMIHEHGGIITPKNVANLTIPLSPEAKRKTARQFGGRLFPVRVNGKKFLAEKKGGGLEFHYLLKDSVQIPAKHYIEAATKIAHGKMTAIYSKSLAALLGLSTMKAKPFRGKFK